MTAHCRLFNPVLHEAGSSVIQKFPVNVFSLSLFSVYDNFANYCLGIMFKKNGKELK